MKKIIAGILSLAIALSMFNSVNIVQAYAYDEMSENMTESLLGSTESSSSGEAESSSSGETESSSSGETESSSSGETESPSSGETESSSSGETESSSSGETESPSSGETESPSTGEIESSSSGETESSSSGESESSSSGESESSSSITEAVDDDIIPVDDVEFQSTSEDFFIFDQLTNTITGYSASISAPRDIVIPKQINGYDVLHIASRAFAGQQLTSVVLNDNLKTIGDYAFENNFIQSITIPDSVTSIGSYVFRTCERLKEINIPTKDKGTIYGEPWAANQAYVFWKDYFKTSEGFIFDAKIGRIDKYLSDNPNVVIPVNISHNEQEYAVKDIKSYAFNSNEIVESVDIQANITELRENVFSFCHKLKSVKLPDTLEIIGVYCFAISPLSEITIPERVREIRESAFNGTSIGSITIPESVEFIGENAFDIYKLSRIDIPTKVSGSIAGAPWGAPNRDLVVYWKDTITTDDFIINTNSQELVKYVGTSSDVIVPETIMHEGQSYTITKAVPRVFAGKSDLNTVDIKAPLETISKEMFYGATVKKVVLPSTVKSIDERAFESSTIQDIKLNEGLVTIGRYAFRRCGKLLEITIPSTVETIGDDAFAGTDIYDNFVEINIPEKESGSIDGEPWGLRKGAVYWKDVIKVAPFVFNTKTKTITAYIGDDRDTNITIPEYIEHNEQQYQVENISANLFFRNTVIQRVNIEAKIKEIPKGVFSSCASLQEVILPDTLETIGDEAFRGCGSIENIIFPESLTTLGSASFYSCEKIQTITLPENLQTIGDRAFGNNYALEQIVIPDSVTTMGRGVFGYCRSLASVKLSENITSIEPETFADCTSLKSITIPEKVNEIYYDAFYNCTSLSTVEIAGDFGESGYISSSAFDKCTSLEEIHLLANNKGEVHGEPWGAPLSTLVYYKDYFKEYPFVYSTTQKSIAKYIGKEESVVIPETITHNGEIYVVEAIEERAFENSSISKINIKANLTSIRDRAFYNCDNLERITLPDSLTFIGDNAFSECAKLRTVNVGNQINLIDYKAFENSNSLKQITIRLARETAPYELTSKQPWGATSSTKVYYLGEFVSFDHTATPVRGQYKKNINISASIKTAISKITLPNGEEIRVGGKYWPSVSYMNGVRNGNKYVYTVDTNGEYMFTGEDTTGIISEYIVYIDDIGKPTLQVTDTKYTFDELATLTEEKVLQTIKAKATTVELGDDFSGGSIELADGELEKIKQMQNHGDTVLVKVKATSPTGLTDEKNVTITLSNTRNVTFNAMGGQPQTYVQENIVGHLVLPPSVLPEKLGYYLEGWYKDSNYTEIFDFAKEIMPREDITVYAKWKEREYEVVFESNGGTPVDKQIIKYGHKVLEPEEIEKPQQAFSGWYKDAECTQPWNFETDVMPAQNITLYAKWEKGYDVIFDTKGGTPIKTKVVRQGRKIPMPKVPQRVNYNFVGWYTNQGYEEDSKWDFERDVMPERNITLYAKWEGIPINIVFMPQNGEKSFEEVVKYGEIVPQPKQPKRKGYKFAGWFVEPECKREWDFSVGIAEGAPTILYAKWVKGRTPNTSDTMDGVKLSLLMFISASATFVVWDKKRKNKK